MKLKYSHTRKVNNLITYHFKLITDAMVYDKDNIPYPRILYFYTFDNMSEFRPNHDITNPREFITLGMEILIQKDYIRNKIVEANKKLKEKENETN